MGKCAEEIHSSSEGPSLSQSKMIQLKTKNPYFEATNKSTLLQNDAGGLKPYLRKTGIRGNKPDVDISILPPLW